MIKRKLLEKLGTVNAKTEQLIDRFWGADRPKIPKWPDDMDIDVGRLFGIDDMDIVDHLLGIDEERRGMLKVIADKEGIDPKEIRWAWIELIPHKLGMEAFREIIAGAPREDRAFAEHIRKMSDLLGKLAG